MNDHDQHAVDEFPYGWEYDQDEDCIHYDIECEQPCPCRCTTCAGSDEDIIGSGED